MKVCSTGIFILILFIVASSTLSCKDDPEPVEPTESNLEIYYYSKRDGTNNIYKSDLLGNETEIVVDTTHHDWWVRISPDKQTMLWYKSPKNVASNDEFNNYDEAELWTANIDGSNAHKVIDLADYNWEAQGVADWSPDSKKLVMAGRKNNIWRIFTTDADGSNPVQISKDTTVDYADPSWSPDGTKVVFSKFVGINLEIHTMNSDGTDETQLTLTDGLQNYDAYWSPDGKEIAFESKWTLLDCFLLGKWSIRKYNFDTQQTTDVIKDDNRNGLARWTKDSEKIYFSVSVCGEFARIARMNRDGSNLEYVLESSEFPYYDCDIVE